MTRIVFVTRPEPQASEWAQQLQQILGNAAQVRAVPLIEVASVAEHAPYQQALHEVWAHLDQWQAAFFVSIPAVRFFFAAVPDALQRWEASPIRAWAPGRGTRQALLDVGVSASRIDAPPPDATQFDSEALWPLVQSQAQPGCAILRVRGTDQLTSHLQDAGAGRDWMAAQLMAAHVRVDTVVAYQRRAPQWSEAYAQQIVTQGAQALWLCSSSQSLGHLAQILPSIQWPHATAICTHARIAERAQDMGFGTVVTTRPTLQDAVQTLQSYL